MITTRDRLPSLTGLRFLAALLVVLYHLSDRVGPIQPITSLVMFGRSGVTFFFVLSGFVLAWTYAGSATSLMVFAWRRFARLWPLVAVTSVLSFLAFAAVGEPVGVWEAISTVLFLQAWHPGLVRGANGAAWSLSAEAFFYALFPLLLAVAVTVTGRRLLWFAALAGVPGLWLSFGLFQWPGWALDYLPLTRLLQFVVGVLFGLAVRRGLKVPGGYWVAAVAVLGYHVLLIVWSELLPAGQFFRVYNGSQWWAVVPFTYLIVVAAQGDVEGRATLLSHAWALRLGHWSFAWYLIHEVVVRLWVHWLPRSDSVAGTARQWVLLLVLTTAAAAALYEWVEHPAEKRLRAWGPPFSWRGAAAVGRPGDAAPAGVA